MQLKTIKKDSKIKSLQENIRFLENRVNMIMTEKEEQAVKLKSELIIQKTLGKEIQDQLLRQQREYHENNEKVLAERIAESKANFESELEKARQKNVKLDKEINKIWEQKQQLIDKDSEFRAQYVSAVKDKDEVIAELKKKLDEIDARYDRKLTKIGGKKEETQKKLNIEEKEREMSVLKLEQMQVNNRKLQL